jgi:hypothetical protein
MPTSSEQTSGKPPLGWPNTPVSGGLSSISTLSSIASQTFVLEQITNPITGSVWYVTRGTTNINDGFLPLSDFSFNAEFLKYGRAVFKKVLINRGSHHTDLNLPLTNLQNGIDQIAKHTNPGQKIPKFINL